MLQRILVALDYDTDTPVAVRYATEIARRVDAEVTGLALVDRRAIKQESSGAGIGAMYYAEKLQESLTDEARAQARHLLRQVAEELDRAGVRHGQDHVEEGVPFRRIVEDMKVHDLLIAGHESRFFYPDRDTRTHTLDEVVERGAAASLIVESEYRPVRRVLIAYDGGVSAARAMQKFAQLRPFDTEGLEVEILHVRGSGSDDRSESELMLGLAERYLRAHGFAHTKPASIESGDVKDALLNHAHRYEADLIVAGAHSQSGLREFFFGSTAKRLIKDADVPLFLYH